MIRRRQPEASGGTVRVVGRVFIWNEDMVADPDGVEGELLGGVCQAHECLGGINITQIGQANAKLHTVSYAMTLQWWARVHPSPRNARPDTRRPAPAGLIVRAPGEGPANPRPGEAFLLLPVAATAQRYAQTCRR